MCGGKENCQPARKAVTELKRNLNYSPMSCSCKFFFVSYCGERTMPPSTFYRKNLIQPVCVLCLLHTSSLLCLNRECQRVCVKLSTSSSSLISQLYRCSSEDRRPLGQLQNNESLKAAPGCRV